MKNILFLVLATLICFYMYYIVFTVPFLIKVIHFSLILLCLAIFLFDFIKNKIKEKNEKLLYQIKKDAEEQKQKIKNIYDKELKNSEYKDVFDQSIFPLVELLYESIEESLKGVFKNRVNGLVTKTMELYVLNIKQAAKYRKAISAGLLLKEDLDKVLEQNKIIMERLKDFVMKIIVAEENSAEFEELVRSFEQNLKTLKILKKDM